MSGQWCGKGEVGPLFRAVFSHNASIDITLRHVSALRPWSPTGTMRVYTEWSFVEKGVDGDVVGSDVVTVAEVSRWRITRSRDYFSNVPGLAAHYATMPLPARRASSHAAG